MNWIIVVAGGNGERIHLGYNKIFARICGKPIIFWTLQQFEKTACIDHVAISAQEKDIPKIRQIIESGGFSKVVDLCPATSSRQASTFTTLNFLKNRINASDLVGIHNAVNPFVKRSEVEAVFKAAQKYQAALLAQPATDTIKITNGDNVVSHTPLRQTAWYAQTPQVAKFDKLWQAFFQAHADDFLGTDDTQLLERIGVQAKIVPCSHQNVKITFPENLILAERIMKGFQDKDYV